MGSTWTKALSVGVPEIDGQHQEILSRADYMLAAAHEGVGGAEVERRMLLLAEYMQDHFAAEERRMRDCRYPRAAEHAAEHRQFLAGFARLGAELHKGDASVGEALSVHRHVCGWLQDHIEQEDRGLGGYISGHSKLAA